MPSGERAKDVLSRRRRNRSEDDEEESLAGLEDSQSEASMPSDAEGEDMVAGDSDVADQDAAMGHIKASDQSDIQTSSSHQQPKARSKGSRTSRKAKDTPTEQEASRGQGTSFQGTADTDIMMNGLQLSDKAVEGETIEFDQMAADQDKPVPKREEATGDRRRSEQENYRKKRDADPTFIPNRGNFFMHDARIPEQRGFGPQGRGRGRGRGGVGGPFSPATQMVQAERTADAPWTHDLHETINDSTPRAERSDQESAGPSTAPITAAPPRVTPANAARPYNFSSSKLLGKAQLRVLLPARKTPVPFSGVPIRQHTRLPDHRPPLRRDKPVRVSLPDKAPRYIFPSQERSFIFIPRALRPNQQGFGSTRGSFGHGQSSRRTSLYGGSLYSPSVALSRRSSLARDIARDQMFSPSGSITARSVVQGGRPVVRLPQGMAMPPNAISPSGSFVGSMPAVTRTYPLPQTPAIEHYRDTATVHQPRPQKTISVSGIDSPAVLSLHAPQQQNQQPFENQIPMHISESNMSSAMPPENLGPPYYSYQGQAGAPLTNIPERAIHAQPFQPPAPAYGQPFYGQYNQQNYYYPPTMPMYMPQGGYAPPGGQLQPEEQAIPQHQHTQSQGAPIVHESNGMVYYLDPNQVDQYPQGGYQGQEGYLQTPSYAVPGAGGIMTPSPETGYYYPQTAYYPQT